MVMVMVIDMVRVRVRARVSTFLSDDPVTICRSMLIRKGL